ncbi:hypothetical protein BH23CYA1_BH23CYA1_09400 [soil metagenome]
MLTQVPYAPITSLTLLLQLRGQVIHIPHIFSIISSYSVSLQPSVGLATAVENQKTVEACLHQSFS